MDPETLVRRWWWRGGIDAVSNPTAVTLTRTLSLQLTSSWAAAHDASRRRFASRFIILAVTARGVASVSIDRETPSTKGVMVAAPPHRFFRSPPGLPKEG